jgi:excisionase family DNA binding protein
MTPVQTISIAEAARRLGIGRNQAYAAARRGEIPVIEFGRTKRVPLPAFDQMLLGHGVASDAIPEAPTEDDSTKK